MKKYEKNSSKNSQNLNIYCNCSNKNLQLIEMSKVRIFFKKCYFKKKVLVVKKTY